MRWRRDQNTVHESVIMRYYDAMSTSSSSDHNIADLQLVLISGLAGSGYSTALNVLEDIGFSAVDNLPLAMIDQLISIEVETSGHKLAVSLDGRTTGFDVDGLVQLMDDIKRRLGDAAKLVFLSASEDELYRRFNATRRQHPLSAISKNDDDASSDLRQAIAEDWVRMAPVQAIADIAIDTSNTNPTDFRSALLGQLKIIPHAAIPVHISSFSYRAGVPVDADMVFDMRFLDNPHWHQDLAKQTGLDDGVQSYLKASGNFNDAMDTITKLVAMALPQFSCEGRPQCVIAFGCTGGRHRSVFSAVTMAEIIQNMGHKVKITHREI